MRKNNLIKTCIVGALLAYGGSTYASDVLNIQLSQDNTIIQSKKYTNQRPKPSDRLFKSKACK